MRSRTHWISLGRDTAFRLGGVVFILLIWQFLSTVGLSEARQWLLPAPLAVFRFCEEHSAELWSAALETSTGTALGLGVGAAVAFILALVFHLIPMLSRTVLPFVSTLPSVPIVAVAPLVVVWIGFGLSSRVVIVAFICFFPILISILTGLSQGYPSQREFFRMQGASLRSRLLYMDLPAAIVFFCAGLRASAPIAVVGAIVAEYVAPKAGLGYMVLTNALRTNVTGLVASAFGCALLGLFFSGVAIGVGKILLRLFPAE